jgi:hypothetical protein
MAEKAKPRRGGKGSRILLAVFDTVACCPANRQARGGTIHQSGSSLSNKR